MLVINKMLGVETKKSLELVIVMNVVNMILYYLHERVYERIRGYYEVSRMRKKDKRT
jgi:uncharacterized membrane protein